ncbi:MAG: DsbC family protein [Burkholderiales bacterium]|nr:DsbC family protein [Burkholderiales bacterium]
MLKRTAIALSLFTVIGAAHSADQDEMRKLLTERMPGMQIGAITKAPYAGLYEVVANGLNVFYTDENANVAIIGRMIDLNTKKDLVEERKQQLLYVDFSSLPIDKAIVKVKGDGSRKLAVFSDPDCPFCQELEQELAKVSNVTIYTFLYPLAELHPDAERKAKLVWCAEDRAKAWDELMLQGKEPTAKEGACDAPLKEISAVAQKARINGTPGLIFSDGKLVPGMIKSIQIERNLAASQPKAAAVQSKN